MDSDDDSLVERILEYTSKHLDLLDRQNSRGNDVDIQDTDDQNIVCLEEIQEEDDSDSEQTSAVPLKEKKYSVEELSMPKIGIALQESEKNSKRNDRYQWLTDTTSANGNIMSNQDYKKLKIKEDETSTEQDFNLEQNTLDVASTSQQENTELNEDDFQPAERTVSTQTSIANDKLEKIDEDMIELVIDNIDDGRIINSDQFTEIDLDDLIKEVFNKKGHKITYIDFTILDFDETNIKSCQRKVNFSDVPESSKEFVMIFRNHSQKEDVLFFFDLEKQFPFKNISENPNDKWKLCFTSKSQKPERNENLKETKKPKLQRRFSLNSFNPHHSHFKKPKFVRSYSLRDIIKKNMHSSHLNNEEEQSQDKTSNTENGSNIEADDKKVTRTFSFEDFDKHRGMIKKLSFKTKNKETKPLENSANKTEKPTVPIKPIRSKKLNSTKSSSDNVQAKSNDGSKNGDLESDTQNTVIIEQPQKPKIVKNRQKSNQAAKMSSELGTTEQPQSIKTDGSSDARNDKPMCLRRTLSKSAIGRGFSRARKSFRSHVGSYGRNEQRNKQDIYESGTETGTSVSNKQDSQHNSSEKKRRKWFSIKQLRKSIGKDSPQAQKTLSTKSSNASASRYQFNDSTNQSSSTKSMDDNKNDPIKQQIIQINIPESLSMQQDKTPITFTIAFNTETGTQNFSASTTESQESEILSKPTAKSADKNGCISDSSVENIILKVQDDKN